MINTTHLLKVSAAWTSVAYVICYAVVHLFPGIRSSFILYGLHMNVDTVTSVTTFGTFLSGLVIWNIIALVSVWIFAALWNGIKK